MDRLESGDYKKAQDACIPKFGHEYSFERLRRLWFERKPAPQQHLEGLLAAVRQAHQENINARRHKLCRIRAILVTAFNFVRMFYDTR